MRKLTIGLFATGAVLALSAGFAQAAGGHAGGAAPTHMSAPSHLNSNGMNARDRDKGDARSDDRQNVHATTKKDKK